MEQVGLVHIDVHRVIPAQNLRVDIVLDGHHVVVQEQLLAVQVPGEAPHTVVHGDDVRIEGANQIVQCGQGRDLPAGGHVNIHPEGGQERFGVVLGVGVHRDMALIQVAQHRIPRRGHRALGDEDSHRGPLGVIVLPGDIQHLGADHIRQGGEDIGQALRVILLVDIGDIVPLLPGRFGVTHVINVKTEGLCQIVEPIEAQFFSHTPYLFSIENEKTVRCSRTACKIHGFLKKRPGATRAPLFRAARGRRPSWSPVQINSLLPRLLTFYKLMRTGRWL